MAYNEFIREANKILGIDSDGAILYFKTSFLEKFLITFGFNSISINRGI